MSLVLVDSGGANISSVMMALQRLDAEAVLTSDVNIIKNADKVIFPGVGAAGAAMEKLHDYDLVECLKGLSQPVLGICVGMQLLFSHSEENDTDMLDILPGNLSKFVASEGVSVPHMGWNDIQRCADHPILNGLTSEDIFYFVHSYYAPVADYTIASCDYGVPFTAIAAQDNFVGCQFHPEKSAKAGAKILKNFLETM